MRARQRQSGAGRARARLVALIPALLAAGPVMAGETCIANRAGVPLLLVVDDLAGGRITATRAGAEPLCLDIPAGQDKSLVGVFADEAALEGCSRLSAPGRTEVLEAFSAFDNCRWRQPPPGG